MSYIESADYILFTGQDPPDDFRELSERASEQIDAVTRWSICGRFECLEKWKQDYIKKATCAQVLYLSENGGMSAISDSGLQSATLGRFSYTVGGTASGSSAGGQTVTPAAISYLAPTGLLYAGVDVR